MTIPFISSAPPAIGSRVKVWFDRKSGDLIVEAEDGKRSRDIYGVCLGDAVFSTEPTVRSSNRCVVNGTFLAVPGTKDSHTVQQEIHAAAIGHLDFYWWRDKAWPLKRARLAYVSKPYGGFPTCYAVDPSIE